MVYMSMGVGARQTHARFSLISLFYRDFWENFMQVGGIIQLVHALATDPAPKLWIFSNTPTEDRQTEALECSIP